MILCVSNHHCLGLEHDENTPHLDQQDLSTCLLVKLLLLLSVPMSCSIYWVGKGGCFPLHYDSDEQVDGRRVTAIFYLNTDWQPSHGGQLQLFPFPDSPVEIAPVADRLVLFSSCRMLHRYLCINSDSLTRSMCRHVGSSAVICCHQTAHDLADKL